MCPHLAASLRPINFHYAQRPAEPHTCANKKVLRHAGTSKTFRPPRHEGAGLRRSERPCTAAGPAGPFMELTWAFEFDGAAAMSEPSQLMLRKLGDETASNVSSWVIVGSQYVGRYLRPGIRKPYHEQSGNRDSENLVRLHATWNIRDSCPSLGGVPSEAPSPGRKCRVDWFCINHRSIYPGIHLSIRLCR